METAITDDVAVVMLTHVNYRTGRMYDLGRITERAHAHGAIMLWDLRTRPAPYRSIYRARMRISPWAVVTSISTADPVRPRICTSQSGIKRTSRPS